jgi:hypothetical protein
LNDACAEAPFHYAACGLMIASAAPISGLQQLDHRGAVDVTVFLHEPAGVTSVPGSPQGAPWYVSPEHGDAGVPWLTVWRLPDGDFQMVYGEGAWFYVEARGTTVRASWRAPLTDVDVATYLLGPVLSLVMRLRGTVPVHASAVAVAGHAALFVGEAWAGKSTTAAAFATRGYAVLSDDIVPLAMHDGLLMASPSYPRVSIWEDTTAGLFGSADALPTFSQTYPKRYLDLAERGFVFQDVSTPVGVIYILGDRDPALEAPRFGALSPRAALMGLVGHTYGGYLLDAPMRADEFDFLSDLVGRVPIRSLSFGEPVGRVAEWCEAIAADMARAQENGA